MIHEVFYKSYGYQSPNYPKKNAIDRADHIICISKSTADDLIRFYNVDQNKISIIDLGTEKKLKVNSKAPIEYPYILYVGNRHKYKNFEMDSEVQAEVASIWPSVTTENLRDVSDFNAYQKEFLELFGFGLDGIDYSKDVEVDRPIQSLSS